MAMLFAASNGCGKRSHQASGAEARDPWEDAAALRSRRSSVPSDPWGTGNTQAGNSVPPIQTWGPRTSTGAPATISWGTSASTEAAATDDWGSPWSSRQVPAFDGWGSMASTEAPITDTWLAPASRVAPATDGWGTMSSTEAPVTFTWCPVPPEAARDAWGHGRAVAGDTWVRSAPERPRFTVLPSSESEVLMNITVGDAKSFLYCGVCSLPLKPPIFQCDAGHAVCSACRDDPLRRRGTARSCNLCRGPGYARCRLMEGLVESLRVACPNAAHGCDATPAYYDLHAHRMACAHAPGTRCPVRACAFVAPMAELLDHFTAVHGWPLTAEERVGRSFDIVLCDGFNVVAAAVRDGSDQQHLLLLNVVRQPFGRTVSAVCIHSQPAVIESLVAAETKTKTVDLELRYWAASHYQESEFRVPFVDLSVGLPDDLALFVVPKSVHPDDDATILVTAYLTIK